VTKGFYFTFEALLFWLAVVTLSLSWPHLVSSNQFAYESAWMLCDDFLVVATSTQEPVKVISSLSTQLNPNPLVSLSLGDEIVLRGENPLDSIVSCEASYWNGARVQLVRLTLNVFSQP